ncbi:MAG: hypothetical protein IJB34_06820 [Clostridia bacterium]|nr:hypothetical protein [Clostridia bacterium]
MKKIKLLLVAILTVMLSLFSLVACGEKGKYNIVSAGSVTVEAGEENSSYIELKSDSVAVVVLKVEVPVVGEVKLEGEGVWAKGEEKGSIVITLEGIEYNATKDGNKLTVKVLGVAFVFEK